MYQRNPGQDSQGVGLWLQTTQEHPGKREENGATLTCTTTFWRAKHPHIKKRNQPASSSQPSFWFHTSATKAWIVTKSPKSDVWKKACNNKKSSTHNQGPSYSKTHKWEDWSM
jgi:hypothetical protein